MTNKGNKMAKNLALLLGLSLGLMALPVVAMAEENNPGLALPVTQKSGAKIPSLKTRPKGEKTSSASTAQHGLHDDKIIFGQVAALGGPAAALGSGMRQGIKTAFAEQNKLGGVHGRTLQLISYDDGYEPDRSITQVRKLIEKDRVFSLIGPVGTPTTKVTQPIATKARVPFIGAFTGAGFLRNHKLGNIVNVRATYAAETEAWISYLVDQKSMTRIAIFFQNDGFGAVVLKGVTAAMNRRGLTLVARGSFKRNSLRIKSALLNVLRSRPDAVVMVGPYKPIASFIKLSKKINFKPTFVNISFVGSKALSSELGKAGEGVIISQVVPFPWDDSLGIVKQYQTALKAYDQKAEIGFVSLEGYLVGRLAIMALQKAGRNVTRQSYLKTFWETGNFDFGGLKMTFGTSDNQGLDKVFLTIIQSDGSFKPMP